ncbi:MAG: alpha/beta fold hydrolase [Planctomycetota bacterium]
MRFQSLGQQAIWVGMVLLCGWAADLSAQTMQERFERIDRNNDGKVTREESGNAPWFAKLLERFDKNKDGVLESAEVASRVPGNSAATRKDADFPAPPNPQHTAFMDIPYDEAGAADARELSLDLYVPKNGQATDRPVMIMIHGGGWRGGDKASPGIVGAKMAHFVGRGYIYASINYRLAPERPGTQGIQHPVQAQDCANAIGWIHNHIAEHGGDPNQIHLMGHSAGAHLAGLIGTNEGFLEKAGVDLAVIKTNVLLDPAALDVPRYIQINRGRAMTGLYDHVFGATPEARIDASPRQHVEAGKPLPPTIIFYAGERMNLNLLAPDFAAAMVAVGIPSQAIDTVILDHGQVNSRVGLVGEPMTELIMQLHAGEDARNFPDSIGPKLSPEEAKHQLEAAKNAARKKREQRRRMSIK